MTNLTEKETAMIVAFIREGAECNGATEAEHVLDDNMTWMSATDLCKVLGWNKQEVGGVMSSLQESSRGAQDNDWYASDKAITEFFHLV